MGGFRRFRCLTPNLLPGLRPKRVPSLRLLQRLPLVSIAARPGSLYLPRIPRISRTISVGHALAMAAPVSIAARPGSLYLPRIPRISRTISVGHALAMAAPVSIAARPWSLYLPRIPRISRTISVGHALAMGASGLDCSQAMEPVLTTHTTHITHHFRRPCSRDGCPGLDCSQAKEPALTTHTTHITHHFRRRGSRDGCLRQIAVASWYFPNKFDSGSAPGAKSIAALHTRNSS